MSNERMADMLPFDFQPDHWGLAAIQVKPEGHILFTDTSKNKDIPFEKAYLHMDRTHYQAGENIWFKAYLTDAVSQKLSVNSNNLYVELISPDLKIIDRKTLRMETGLGNGDF
ncbi:MAG: hypothetical protein HC831_19260, partial [Chloroflexia bacterium]|nr:hypothetical protein [Chloroflexia bacterium]